METNTTLYKELTRQSEALYLTVIKIEINNHIKNGDKNVTFDCLTFDNLLGLLKLGYKITYLNNKWTIHLTV
ncbi:hypothetical protein IGI58_001649 [Enterococcus sp. AZ020]